MPQIIGGIKRFDGWYREHMGCGRQSCKRPRGWHQKHHNLAVEPTQRLINDAWVIANLPASNRVPVSDMMAMPMAQGSGGHSAKMPVWLTTQWKALSLIHAGTLTLWATSTASAARKSVDGKSSLAVTLDDSALDSWYREIGRRDQPTAWCRAE